MPSPRTLVSRARDRITDAASSARDRARAIAPGAWDLAAEVASDARNVRITGLAAEVAFFAVLSVFPALVAVAAGLGSLDSLAGREVAATVEAEVVSFLERVLTSEASGAIAAVRELFEQDSSSIVTLSGAGAVWAASRGFAALIRALDVVFSVEERRSYVRLRVIALGLAAGTIIMGVVVLAMIVIGPLLGSGHDLADALGFGGVFAVAWDLARWPAAAIALLLWASALMRVAPNRRERVVRDLGGAAVTASTWALASVGLHLYLDLAGGGNQVLGVLGGPLIVLVWLYLLAAGLLLGAVVNRVAEKRRAGA